MDSINQDKAALADSVCIYVSVFQFQFIGHICTDMFQAYFYIGHTDMADRHQMRCIGLYQFGIFIISIHMLSEIVQLSITILMNLL